MIAHIHTSTLRSTPPLVKPSPKSFLLATTKAFPNLSHKVDGARRLHLNSEAQKCQTALSAEQRSTETTSSSRSRKCRVGRLHRDCSHQLKLLVSVTLLQPGVSIYGRRRRPRLCIADMSSRTFNVDLHSNMNAHDFFFLIVYEWGQNPLPHTEFVAFRINMRTFEATIYLKKFITDEMCSFAGSKM